MGQGRVALEKILSELESLLYGGDYQVCLRLYRVPYLRNAGAERYVLEALGAHVVPAEVERSTAEEILREVEQSLQYPGDEHCGPDPGVLESRRFKALLQTLLAELDRPIARASVLARFTLRDEHHPCYPVYWGFAYVIAAPAGALVFIGSSSD